MNPLNQILQLPGDMHDECHLPENQPNPTVFFRVQDAYPLPPKIGWAGEQLRKQGYSD
jgi:hypothetical protein